MRVSRDQRVHARGTSKRDQVLIARILTQLDSGRLRVAEHGAIAPHELDEHAGFFLGNVASELLASQYIRELHEQKLRYDQLKRAGVKFREKLGARARRADQRGD